MVWKKCWKVQGASFTGSRWIQTVLDGSFVFYLFYTCLICLLCSLFHGPWKEFLVASRCNPVPKTIRESETCVADCWERNTWAQLCFICLTCYFICQPQLKMTTGHQSHCSQIGDATWYNSGNYVKKSMTSTSPQRPFLQASQSPSWHCQNYFDKFLARVTGLDSWSASLDVAGPGLFNFVLKSNISGSRGSTLDRIMKKVKCFRRKTMIHVIHGFTLNCWVWHVFNLFKRTAADGASDSEQGCALAATNSNNASDGLLVLQIGNEGMIHFIVINDHPIPPATHPFPAWNAPVSSKVLLIHDPNLWVPICCQQMFIHRYSAHNPSSWDASKAGRGRIDVRSTAAGLRHCLFLEHLDALIWFDDLAI